MIHAYDKNYLEKAQALLGRMLDFAVYDFNVDVEKFYKKFCDSEYARRFEIGDTSLLSGKSGVELAYDIIGNSTVKPKFTTNRSPEYWAGWVLAYYQWYTSFTFNQINDTASIKDIINMYSKYHEMDIMQFVDSMNEMYAQKNHTTNLKKRRIGAELSQSELAKISGVPLRTLQQYEQRQKNINSAKVETVLALSQALSCDIKDILENLNQDEFDIEKYKNSLKNTKMIDVNKMNPDKKKVDLSNLIKYAKEHNKAVYELTDEEKSKFITD